GHRLWLAPGVRALHLGLMPGGCGMRFLPLGEAMRQQRRSHVYVILTQERSFERISLRAWLRMLRGTVVRRDVLRAGPQAGRSAWRGLLESLGEVRAFWREHSPSAASGRALGKAARPQHP